MNDRGTIVSALDWAARMQRGEVAYNSYIAALAEEVTSVREENDRYRELLGIHVDEDAMAWTDVVISLRSARKRIGELEQALKRFTGALQPNAVQQMSLGGESFMLLPDRVAKEMLSAISEARTLLEDKEATR